MSNFPCRAAAASLRAQRRTAAVLAIAVALSFPTGHPLFGNEGPSRIMVGPRGTVGCGADARRVQRLVIDAPGVYENLLVDGEWGTSTLVKITADDVTLRNCEIRHGRHNAVTVSARNVVIDSCRIHHVLAGSFGRQQDAHGITGRPGGLVIRNCDIGLTSGDSIQFDPGRGEWDDVLIENCRLWTGPLPADAADFRAGERPGENAVDTKQQASNPRSRMMIRNCVLSGWNQPGQISNLAALNLKNHVQVTVENCVFFDNEICFRLRGGTDERGGAHVSITNCAVYDSHLAIRAEDHIEHVKVTKLGVGDDIGRVLQTVGGGTGSGFENTQQYAPPPLQSVLEHGL